MVQSKRILMLQKETDKFRSDLEKQTKALGRDIEMMHDKYLASQAARTNFCNKLEREVSASKALRHAKMSYEAEVNGVDDYAALKYFAVSVGFVLLMLL
ncbi:hypothetical protein QVD17_40467 [Tagetes erecta]|uniref:Uncharacterized protein n=1 Tax=Tagetes erecta TaxID=13708 RepID=A0AAD8JS01_TARER|nr:hypothetical protein QVD17_40467 [Tagetes erecta]